MLRWTKPMSKDGIGDGWDPSIPYQLLPTARTRFMMLETGNQPVHLEVTQGVSCGLTNFHVIRPFGKAIPGLPTTTSAVKSVVIPANVEVQFDLSAGAAPGQGFLRVHTLFNGVKSPSPTLEMVLSVKLRTSRNFLACFVFDRINPDTGVRAPVDTAIEATNKIFHEQANI